MEPTSNVTTVSIDGHEYNIKPHPPLNGGQDFAMRILAIGAKPLMRLGSSLLKAKGLGGLQALMGQDATVLLEEFNFEELGVDAQEVLLELSKEPELIRSLFNHTTRDGKLLKADQAYNDAFAGNWGEWRKAAFHIIKINGFLSFGGSSGTSEAETEQ